MLRYSGPEEPKGYIMPQVPICFENDYSFNEKILINKIEMLEKENKILKNEIKKIKSKHP